MLAALSAVLPRKTLPNPTERGKMKSSLYFMVELIAVCELFFIQERAKAPLYYSYILIQLHRSFDIVPAFFLSPSTSQNALDRMLMKQDRTPDISSQALNLHRCCRGDLRIFDEGYYSYAQHDIKNNRFAKV